MNITYYKWLELVVTNNYFPKSIFPAFRIVPLSETVHMLKNHNILIDKKGNAASLYVGSGKSSPSDAIMDLAGMGKAYFQLIGTDTSFYKYTEIDEKREGWVLFFDSPGNGHNTLSLQKGEYVSSKDSLKCKPKMFNLSIPGDKVEILIKNKEGQTILKPVAHGNGPKKCLIDLSTQNAGVYTVWFNNELQETFFCSDGLNEHCIGVWCLDVPSLLAKTKEAQVFKLDFNARAVHWQYEVVHGKSRKIEIQDIGILGNHGETYEGPYEKEMIGGQIAKVYTTAKPLQLQYVLEKTPQLQLNYTSDFSDRMEQLEMELPNPAAGQLGKYQTGAYEGAFYTTSIVYV